MKKDKYALILQATILVSTLFVFSISQAQSWEWGRGSAGPGVDGWAVAVDPSGNVFGAGIESGTGPVTFGPYTGGGGGTDQIVWAKYDNSGTPLWAGGTSSGSAILYNITTDRLGNLIVFGGFSSATMKIGPFTLSNIYGGAAAQYFLAKIDPSGTVLWAHSDGNAMSYPVLMLGSVSIMGVGGVTTDTADNIYITSSFEKTSMTIGTNTLTNAGSGTNDIFVAKYTPSGAVAWASSIGGTGDDYGFGIAIAAGGDVYVTGGFSSASMTVGPSIIADPYSNPLAYIAKFSSTGIPLWGQAAGGTHGAFGVGLASDNYGNVYMTGGFCDASISFGSATVSRTYPAAVPKLALFLVQYSSANVVTWSKTIGSPTAPVWGYGIALSACGQIWVCGNYFDSANIDGNTLALVPSFGGLYYDPAFIAGYKISGGVIGYSGLGSGGDDQSGIACDGNGNVFVCSDYMGGIFLGPDSLISATSDEDFYIGKYGFPTGHTHHDTTVCLLTDGSVTISAHDTGTAPDYLWYDGTTTRTTTVTSGGNYWVQILNGCRVTVDTIHLTINYVGAITGLSEVCTGSTISLSDTSAGGVWSAGNGHATVSAGGVVTGISVGNDTIKYTITNASCTNTVSNIVTVKKCQTAVQSVANTDNNVFHIFPNPNEGTFAINLNSDIDEVVTIVITDVMGKKVKEFTTATNKAMDVKLNEGAGVYFLSATDGVGRYFAKIVVE